MAVLLIKIVLAGVVGAFCIALFMFSLFLGLQVSTTLGNLGLLVSFTLPAVLVVLYIYRKQIKAWLIKISKRQ